MFSRCRLIRRVETAAEGGHQLQCFVADVVFDAFAVCCRCIRTGSQCQQEAKDDVVSAAREFCQCAAFVGESYGTVGFCVSEAVTFQACDGAIDGDVTDFKATCQIPDSTFPGLLFQFCDGFDVILRQFRSVIAAGSEVAGDVLALVRHESRSSEGTQGPDAGRGGHSERVFLQQLVNLFLCDTADDFHVIGDGSVFLSIEPVGAE